MVQLVLSEKKITLNNFSFLINYTLLADTRVALQRVSRQTFWLNQTLFSRHGCWSSNPAEQNISVGRWRRFPTVCLILQTSQILQCLSTLYHVRHRAQWMHSLCFRSCNGATWQKMASKDWQPGYLSSPADWYHSLCKTHP